MSDEYESEREAERTHNAYGSEVTTFKGLLYEMASLGRENVERQISAVVEGLLGAITEMTHTEGDRPAMKEATNMGAERGPSREAMEWAENTPLAEVGPTEALAIAFDAGREAERARTCEWTRADGPNDFYWTLVPGCNPKHSAPWLYADIVGVREECPYCKAKLIVVAAQDRG